MTENDDDFKVEIWNDPVWTPALAALTDGSNPKPLAELLRKGLVPPDIVAEQLGIMLDPPQGYKGPSLIIKTPKRGRREAITALAEARELRTKIIEAQAKYGKLESAVAAVQAETGLSRSKLFKVLQLDDREVVLRSQLILGHGPNSPRKGSPRKQDKISIL